MKLSLKFHNNDENQQIQIMTAKVPITIFNNPLISTITATGNSSSDFSFSLSTNFPSGPTFKLSYTPPIAATTTTLSPPFSLSLKSGLGLFGSPHNSPLVFSANFSLSSFSSSTPLLPSFSLHFKPQFGHFSLHKTVFSDSNTNTNTNTNTKTVFDSNPLSVSPQIEKGFVNFSNGCSSGWQNLKLEPFGENNKNNDNNVVDGGVGVAVGVVPDDKNSEKCGLSPCVALMTKTVLPVTQGLLLNFRWDVNFPGKSGLKVPYLTVNKIGLERVEEEKKNELKFDNCEGDLKMLKEKKMDLENVEKENKELKKVLDEMKMRVSKGKVEKQQNSGESFQSWGSNRNGRKENEKKQQPNKLQNTIVVSDLESELEKAIKAASS